MTSPPTLYPSAPSDTSCPSCGGTRPTCCSCPDDPIALGDVLLYEGRPCLYVWDSESGPLVSFLDGAEDLVVPRGLLSLAPLDVTRAMHRRFWALRSRS